MAAASGDGAGGMRLDAVMEEVRGLLSGARESVVAAVASAGPAKPARRTVKAQGWMARWDALAGEFHVHCAALEGGFVHFFMDDAQTKKDPTASSFNVQGCAVAVADGGAGNPPVLVLTASDLERRELLVCADSAELIAMARHILRATRRQAAELSDAEQAILAADATLESVLVKGSSSLPAPAPSRLPASPHSPSGASGEAAASKPRPVSMAPPIDTRVRTRSVVKREGFLVLAMPSSPAQPKRFWFELQGGFLAWFTDERDGPPIASGAAAEQPRGRIALSDVELAAEPAAVDAASRLASALAPFTTAQTGDWFAAHVTSFAVVRRRVEERVHSPDSAEPIIKTKVAMVREPSEYVLCAQDRALIHDWLDDLHAMAKMEQRRAAAAADANALAGAVRKQL